ncbi:MAG TPA: nuclear transport factor 2 family protein [Anaeromyxobacter sp.]|nr:nuclear transport factor 2 family protein [Anaeromyxobacter sp.]
MTRDPRTIAVSYVEACGRRDFDAVAPLLAPDVRVRGPARVIEGAAPYLAVLRQLGAIWAGSTVRKVFADGADACVFYEFVSDTPAGAVPMVEWVRVEEGKIRAIELFYDRVAFEAAREELERRVARKVG